MPVGGRSAIRRAQGFSFAGEPRKRARPIVLCIVLGVQLSAAGVGWVDARRIELSRRRLDLTRFTVDARTAGVILINLSPNNF